MNLEEIKAAIAENPELEAQIVTLGLQTETGKTVLNNHLANNKDSISKAAYDEATKAAYGNMDKILKEFGFEKQEGEKSTEAQARAIKSLQEKIAQAGATAEDKEANEKMIQAIKAQADKEKADLLAQLEEERTSNRTNSIKTRLIDAKADFNYNPNYDKVVIDKFVKDAEAQLVKGAKQQKDGSYIYYDENGLPYLNDLRAPATEKEILTRLLKPVLAVSGAGGGAGQEPKPSASLVDGKVNLKGDYSTQVELYEAFEKAAAALSLPKRTKEFNEQWEIVKKQHNYQDLKRR